MVLDGYVILNGERKFIERGNAFVNPTETEFISWSETYDSGDEKALCTYQNIEYPEKNRFVIIEDKLS